MPRLLTLPLTAFALALAPATGAFAASPPSAVHASQADDSGTADLCATTRAAPASDETVTPEEQAAVDAIMAGINSGDGSDPAADTAGDPPPAGNTLDLTSACGADPSGEAADGGSTTTSASKLLASGALKTGSVSLKGAGRVTQELWMPGSARASRACLSGRGAKGKTCGKVFAGRATRSLAGPGVVSLSIHLSAAARKALKATKKDLHFTVKTTIRLQGAKPTTKFGTVIVKYKRGA